MGRVTGRVTGMVVSSVICRVKARVRYGCAGDSIHDLDFTILRFYDFRSRNQKQTESGSKSE